MAVGDRRFGVLVRIEYAAALNRRLSLGVVPIQNGWGDLTDTEPGLRAALGPPLKLNTNPEIDRLKSDCKSRSLGEQSGNRS